MYKEYTERLLKILSPYIKEDVKISSDVDENSNEYFYVGDEDFIFDENESSGEFLDDLFEYLDGDDIAYHIDYDYEGSTNILIPYLIQAEPTKELRKRMFDMVTDSLYVVEPERYIERFTDDGEPNILEYIGMLDKSLQEIKDCVGAIGHPDAENIIQSAQIKHDKTMLSFISMFICWHLDSWGKKDYEEALKILLQDATENPENYWPLEVSEIKAKSEDIQNRYQQIFNNIKEENDYDYDPIDYSAPNWYTEWVNDGWN